MTMILATEHARQRDHSRYAIDVAADDTIAEHVALILAGESKLLGKQHANGRWGRREVRAFYCDGVMYRIVWSPVSRRIVTYLPSGG
jgi:hypothetical protein